MPDAKAPLVYLKEQLGFHLSEWSGLDAVTKEWYRQAATAEMQILGIPIK
jgi:hypothetical protein